MPNSTELPPGQQQPLQDALLCAFPTRTALAQMVRNGLGKNLATISDGSNLAQVVFELVEWAIAQQQLDDLLTAARATNPDNTALHSFATASTPPTGDQHAAAPDSAALLNEESRRAVILTALPLEYQAVRAHLCNIREETHRQGTVYERGAFVARQGWWDVTIAVIGPGNMGAAFEAERAIAQFDPQVVLFVGVAGGLKDVQVGDVVVSTKVYGYESGKAEDIDFRPRPDVGESSYRLVQRAQAVASRKEWLKRIRGPQAKPAPQIFIGPIAAGEKVLAGTHSALWQFLHSHYGDALAIEMEGRGFLRATHANDQVRALIIRGISDLVQGKQAADAGGSQEQAARHASAFAFAILAELDQTEYSNEPHIVVPSPIDPPQDPARGTAFLMGYLAFTLFVVTGGLGLLVILSPIVYNALLLWIILAAIGTLLLFAFLLLSVAASTWTTSSNRAQEYMQLSWLCGGGGVVTGLAFLGGATIWSWGQPDVFGYLVVISIMLVILTLLFGPHLLVLWKRDLAQNPYLARIFNSTLALASIILAGATGFTDTFPIWISIPLFMVGILMIVIFLLTWIRRDSFFHPLGRRSTDNSDRRR